MKHPDTLWKSSINKCPSSSDHKCQRPSRRSVVGTAGDSWRDNLCPAPYHRAFSLPGRYEKRVMGSQVTNRVSIVHERPLPYKALQRWLLGAGERGFRGTLLERIFSARAGDGLFLPPSRGCQGRQSPLSGAAGPGWGCGIQTGRRGPAGTAAPSRRAAVPRGEEQGPGLRAPPLPRRAPAASITTEISPSLANISARRAASEWI